ncbi:class IV adenylate cyclase [Phycisphaerales bacterium AB-hyl4]|uniref:Class IV adenylate cyclase n=1 Tax=Natronomicrosphaera hydrolytica TaxID=3242702 RepID=A0ABV4U263_9BACT
MNVEIEAKMRLIDRAAVESRLKELNAGVDAEWLEINTYFDTPQRGLKSSDQGLRIRTEVAADGQRTVTITHKGPRAHGRLKSRSECEVNVSDPGQAATLLRALGYAPVLSFEKRRQRWHLNDCHVEIDVLPYLGEFIEIEGGSEEAVLAVREQLGLKEAPLIRASYIAMLMTYIRENQMQEQAIRFNGSTGPTESVDKIVAAAAD